MNLHRILNGDLQTGEVHRWVCLLRWAWDIKEKDVEIVLELPLFQEKKLVADVTVLEVDLRKTTAIRKKEKKETKTERKEIGNATENGNAIVIKEIVVVKEVVAETATATVTVKEIEEDVTGRARVEVEVLHHTNVHRRGRNVSVVKVKAHQIDLIQFYFAICNFAKFCFSICLLSPELVRPSE